MKLGEVVVHDYYNFTRFHQNRMENKKSFINSPFFVFLVHLFSYSLIFAYSFLNDLALKLPEMQFYEKKLIYLISGVFFA